MGPGESLFYDFALGRDGHSISLAVHPESFVKDYMWSSTQANRVTVLLFSAMEARAQQRLERKKALDEKKRKVEEEKLVCEHPLLLLFCSIFLAYFIFNARLYVRTFSANFINFSAPYGQI